MGDSRLDSTDQSVRPPLTAKGTTREQTDFFTPLSYLTDLERQTAPGRLATECSVAMNALTAAD